MGCENSYLAFDKMNGLNSSMMQDHNERGNYNQGAYQQSVYQPGYQYPVQQSYINQQAVDGPAHYQPQYNQQVASQPMENKYPSNQISQMKLQSAHIRQACQKKKKSFRVADRRGLMQLYVDKKDNFLNHHLKSQIHLSRYAQADLIKRRQILQHNRYEEILNRGYGSNISFLNEVAMKAYFQRVMLEIFETAEKEFLQQGKSYDQVRQKVAQRYLFEMYQNKQFMDAGLGKYQTFTILTQLPMSSTALVSDSALFPILRFLKQKYPQVADKTSIKFPQVKQRKNDVNLLDNFASKCYSSPELINLQTLFNDLKFLIDRSVDEFADFQSDMKLILGQDVLTDSKVKRIVKNGNEEYSASPVRRVFIKWAQTILERIPEIILTSAFLQFIKAKAIIADNFYFKSTVQATTHGRVIQCLCQLLQAAKYKMSELSERKQFGFYIYDLLRCKSKRSTGQQVCALLDKMEGTKVTAAGYKFQVIRIKNRFQTANRDLMVNFRYGDVLVAQAQLCIDTSDVSEKTKMTNKFNHYIYELQRGLFGPTCQLIMQYEDFQRKDISANLQAQGPVNKRYKKQLLSFLRKANRKCFNNHDMIQLKGNYFLSGEDGQYREQTDVSCDFCLNKFNSSVAYHYCYFCTITFCTGCHQVYKKHNVKQIQLRCNLRNMLTPLKNEQQLGNAMGQTPIVIFYVSDNASSIIYSDMLVYLLAVYKMQKKKLPGIYTFCCDEKQSIPVQNKYGIKKFPTTIVFSSEGTPQTTLIGASWSLIQGLFQTQENLSQGKCKALQVTCWCGSPYQQFQNQEDQQIFCLNCGNANQSQGFFDSLLGQDNSKVFMCQTGHSRCLNCSFLADEMPSQYIDHRGQSYLCSKKYEVNLIICPLGHQTVYTKQIGQVKETKCFKCNKNFVFNNQLGAGICVQCNIYCCFACIGIDDDTLKQIQGELINHTVQSTAEQGQRCVCNRLFKKVYNTRDYKVNIIQNKPQQEDRTQQLLQSVYLPKQRQWQCIICQRIKKDGQLHLACFMCPFLKDQRINIQICIQCAIGSDLLNRQLEKRITQVKTQLVCKLNHPVVRTRLSESKDQMTYQCSGCKTTQYVYTQRFYCKKCKTNVCLKCANDHLKNTDPPKCLRNCSNNHKMATKENPDSLRFCDGCKTTIRKLHFYCLMNCNFEFCLNCAATPPGVNTANNRMKHIDEEKVRKQMQQYKRGWIDDIGQALNEGNENSQDNLKLGQVVNQIQNGWNQLNEWWDS